MAELSHVVAAPAAATALQLRLPWSLPICIPTTLIQLINKSQTPASRLACALGRTHPVPFPSISLSNALCHTCISLPDLSLLSLKSPLVHMHHPLSRSTPSIPISFTHISRFHRSRVHSSMRLTQSLIFHPYTNRSDMSASKKL